MVGSIFHSRYGRIAIGKVVPRRRPGKAHSRCPNEAMSQTRRPATMPGKMPAGDAPERVRRLAPGFCAASSTARSMPTRLAVIRRMSQVWRSRRDRRPDRRVNRGSASPSRSRPHMEDIQRDAEHDAGTISGSNSRLFTASRQRKRPRTRQTAPGTPIARRSPSRPRRPADEREIR